MSTVTSIEPDLRKPLCPAFRRNLLKILRALDPSMSLEPQIASPVPGVWHVRSADGETWKQDSTEDEARTDLDRHLFSLARTAACAQAAGRAECMVGTFQPALGGWQWAGMSMADARKRADLALVAGVPVKLAPIAEDYTS